jgi:hypothetical protein
MFHCQARIVPRAAGLSAGKLVPAAVLALTLCWGCHSELTRYYPLEAGLAWQYQVSLAHDGDLITTMADVSNLQPADVFGKRGVPQRSEMFGQSLVRFIAEDSRGVFEYAQQSEGAGTPVGKDAPNYLLRAPVAQGTTWSSVWQSERDGRQVTLPTVKSIAATDETVIVPAGTFADCVRLKITGRAAVDLVNGPATIEVRGDEWYAPKIGLIKGMFRETVDGGQASSELAMDLASFVKPR